MKYQLKIANDEERFSRILRADLTSLPFSSHEIQSRWAGLGYIHYLPQIFNKIVPIPADQKNISRSLLQHIQAIVDEDCADDELCIFITPRKYISETRFCAEGLKKVHVIMPHEFTSKNFKIHHHVLKHKHTNKVVRLIFRRELTIANLVRSEFGRKILKAYMVKELNFEPDLDIGNDMKIGMALAFDIRTKRFFSDNSRKLFLPTSLFEQNMYSFNSVFGKKFSDVTDLQSKVTKSQRRYVFKYAGLKLNMSFGGRSVFRLDKNNIDRLLGEKYDANQVWILQKLDQTKYKHRYIVGDYENPSSLEIKIGNFGARIKALFWRKSNGRVRLVDITANLGNDHWKVRSRTSDQARGLGTVTTVTRIKRDINGESRSA